MPNFIDRDEVQRLVEERGATVAEVLPRPEYEWAHLPDAIHLPLKGWSVEQLEDQLDVDRPVIVYCSNHQCDMSPRAAWRLETLGYEAHDYVAGKQDWLAFDLPYEGEAVLAGDQANREVPTCHWQDRMGDVRDRLAGSPVGTLVVLNDRDVVLGRLDSDALELDDDRVMADVMREGPTTVRPSEDVELLGERMAQAGVGAVLVTRSDGTLVGLFEHRAPHQH